MTAFSKQVEVLVGMNFKSYSQIISAVVIIYLPEPSARKYEQEVDKRSCNHLELLVSLPVTKQMNKKLQSFHYKRSFKSCHDIIEPSQVTLIII